MKSLTPQQVIRLQSVLVAAQQAIRSGQNVQAERLFLDILKEAPQAYDVQHQFALFLATTGRPADAAKHFRIIVKANPAHAMSHANLGNALAESGELDEAIVEYRRAIALDQKLVGAYIGLGAALRKAEKSEEAINYYKAALDRDKVNHAAFNGLGLAYRDIDDLPRALEGLEHAVGLAPNNADYRLNLGVTLRRYKLLDWAAEEFYEAIKLRPDWLEAVVFLAEVLQEQRRFDESKECYERALQLKPSEAELHERLGFVYLDMGDTEQALQEFSSVLNEHPTRFMAMLGRGRAHMEAGYSEQAASYLEDVVKVHPENSSGYFNLAVSRKFTPEDPVIQQLQPLVDKTAEDDPASIGFNFALGKIYDDCKLWDEAFECYERGNRVRNKEYEYDPLEEEEKFDELIRAFNQNFIETHKNLGVVSDTPVIIVGMPRSGTTLTEQIISSHPQVMGAGEVVFWGMAPRAVPLMLDTDESYPGCITHLTINHASTIARKYIEQLHKIVGPTANVLRITDKMPHNFVQLGLIALLFPKASIVHCKRDAMDNCLSIYFQNFAGRHPYAYDLKNIGHQHKQYEKIMLHWHRVFPGRILDINYEDTIADPEYWSRVLIDHVGLEWDDACLAPHKLERTVKTASHWQVRQPIYKTSVKRWKNYEKHLGSLKEALGYEE